MISLPSVRAELKKRSGEQKGAAPEKTAQKRQAARRARQELPCEDVVMVTPAPSAVRSAAAKTQDKQ